MVSTVTTTTVTTIMTITLAASLQIVAILALLVFLIQKELFSFTATPGAKTLGNFLNRVLNIAIIPLLVSFVFIVVVKIAEVMQ